MLTVLRLVLAHFLGGKLVDLQIGWATALAAVHFGSMDVQVGPACRVGPLRGPSMEPGWATDELLKNNFVVWQQTIGSRITSTLLDAKSY